MVVFVAAVFVVASVIIVFAVVVLIVISITDSFTGWLPRFRRSKLTRCQSSVVNDPTTNTKQTPVDR